MMGERPIISKSEKDNYFVQINFHRDIKATIEQYYDLEVRWTQVIAWGYRTVALYMEDTAHNKYIVKVTPYTLEKEEKLNTSTQLEQFLNKYLPTAFYFKNKQGNYLTRHYEIDNQGKKRSMILRVQNHIEGIPPFDMNTDVYKQMLEILKKIHSIKTPDKIHMRVFDKGDLKKYVFLHGDLTPANVLISYGKLTGVLDFEESMLGPIEYDLSRTMVFSWYYMKDTSIKEIYNLTWENYQIKNQDVKLFFELAEYHLNNRLSNLELHKSEYENISAWEEDKTFTTERLQALKNFSATTLK